MPEGHTIHRLARDHQKWFGGKTVEVTSPQGRFSEDAKRITGKRLSSIDAHGKHLFYQFGKQSFLHIHLGLYGKFRLFKTPMPAPKGEVRVRLVGDTHGFDLNGPNQCELINAEQFLSLRERLGVDPLRKDSDPEVLWQKMQRSKKPLGALLLDQSVIAGVGNIYRAEILYLLRIHPARLAKAVSREEFDQLWSLTKRLLEIGVRYNRIITVTKDDVGKPLTRLSNQERLHIYKKERCPECGKAVAVTDLGARSIYYCENCQTW
ncbi:MAG: Fpg/Nei family DNA glycosylase [Pirellula sp.]|jgi:endonuclease-8|nr:Fpg/Nei family DNA glycosylase [Pirellula sp.]